MLRHLDLRNESVHDQLESTFPDQNRASLLRLANSGSRAFPRSMSNKGKRQQARVYNFPTDIFKRGEERVIKSSQKASLHREACG